MLLWCICGVITNWIADKPTITGVLITVIFTPRETSPSNDNLHLADIFLLRRKRIFTVFPHNQWSTFAIASISPVFLDLSTCSAQVKHSDLPSIRDHVCPCWAAPCGRYAAITAVAAVKNTIWILTSIWAFESESRDQRSVFPCSSGSPIVTVASSKLMLSTSPQIGPALIEGFLGPCLSLTFLIQIYRAFHMAQPG